MIKHMSRTSTSCAENKTHDIMTYRSSTDQSSLAEAQSTTTRLGEPTKLRLLGFIDLFSILLSLLSLAVAFLVISSRLPWAWAWKLGMTNQIIIIGFLLSIQTLCLRRIVPLCWLMLEAKFGGSVLQNYDAIIQNTALIRHTSLVWRCVIIFFLMLPICLSVAYKQCANHTSTFDLGLAHLTLGLFGPPGLNNFGFNTGLYLMVNATQPYMIALQANDPSPDDVSHMLDQGSGYGFNNLVFADGISAFLDVPAPEVIDEIQRNLRPTETQYLRATVNAIVTTHQPLSPEQRNSSDFWGQYSESSNSSYSGQLQLHPSANLSMFIASGPNVDTSWCFLALYPSAAEDRREPYKNYEYRMHAEMFVTHRTQCNASWSITATSMRIESGHCGQTFANQEYFNSTRDRGWYDLYLQPLSELLGGYISNGNDQQTTIPAMANAIAAMYWSRFVAMDGYDLEQASINGTEPPRISEAQRNDSFYTSPVKILSTVQTLDSSYPLHLILGLQPFLLILAVCCIVFMRHVPIDHGFGLATVLSAVDRSSITRIEGGSLSGRLSRQVPIRITVDHLHHLHHRTNSFTSDYKNDFVHRYSGKFHNDFHHEIPPAAGEGHGLVRFEIDEQKGPMTRGNLLQRGVLYR